MSILADLFAINDLLQKTRPVSVDFAKASYFSTDDHTAFEKRMWSHGKAVTSHGKYHIREKESSTQALYHLHYNTGQSGLTHHLGRFPTHGAAVRAAVQHHASHVEKKNFSADGDFSYRVSPNVIENDAEHAKLFKGIPGTHKREHAFFGSSHKIHHYHGPEHIGSVQTSLKKHGYTEFGGKRLKKAANISMYSSKNRKFTATIDHKTGTTTLHRHDMR